MPSRAIPETFQAILGVLFQEPHSLELKHLAHDIVPDSLTKDVLGIKIGFIGIPNFLTYPGD